MLVTCNICGRRIWSVELAIRHGWIPSYYEAGEDEETSEAVCPRCVAKHLEADEENGVFVRVTD